MTDRRRPATEAPLRRQQINFRLSDAEHEAMRERAAAAGLDLVAWIRQRTLGRANGLKPATPPDKVDLRRCMATLDESGRPLFALLRLAQVGEAPAYDELKRAAAAHTDALANLMLALRKPTG